MTNHKSIHEVQAEVIKYLAKNDSARFAELNRKRLTTDWFNYHVNQLLKLELIVKDKDSNYSLTSKGKELSLNISNKTSTILKNQRVSVLIICNYIEDRVIVQKRLIEPFKNYYELPTEKVLIGENPEDTAFRCLIEETGLKAEFIFKGVNHKIDKDNEGSIVHDKFYLIYEAINVKGELKDVFDNGENLLMTLDELLNKDNRHFDLENTINIYKSKGIRLMNVDS
ncbi:MAG: NUDIX hydrolase [Candidatus Dojkabacteria bacterium]|nr:NUDIX hydrolase [Candidatus Dojkabacteria bacterium]MDQ7021050.1 NUDIX hydrolase [Candidatus Dojkabacteria bacterium]